LEDGQVIPDEKFRPGYEKQTGLEIHRTCRIKKEGTTF
jgi:superoxide dismutase